MRTALTCAVICFSIAACDGDDMPVTPSSAIVSALPPIDLRISNEACGQGSHAYALRIAARDMKNDIAISGAELRIDGSDFRSETSWNGVYEWRRDELPATSTILIACPRAHAFDFNPPIVARVPYSLGQCQEITVGINLSRCRPSGETVRKVRLRGVYVAQFESLRFFPCDGPPKEMSEYLLGSDSAIWVDTSMLAGQDQTMIALIGLVARTESSSFSYADWSGTLSGPGSYGHLGGSAYEFRPIAASEISMSKPDDCEAPGFAEWMALSN